MTDKPAIPMETDAAPGPPTEAAGALPADGEFVPPPKRLVTLSMVCVLLAMFLAAMSQTVVATILPLMVADVGGFERYGLGRNLLHGRGHGRLSDRGQAE